VDGEAEMENAQSATGWAFFIECWDWMAFYIHYSKLCNWLQGNPQAPLKRLAVAVLGSWYRAAGVDPECSE
jgi:hypothetical protein